MPNLRLTSKKREQKSRKQSYFIRLQSCAFLKLWSLSIISKKRTNCSGDMSLSNVNLKLQKQLLRLLRDSLSKLHRDVSLSNITEHRMLQDVYDAHVYLGKP